MNGVEAGILLGWAAITIVTTGWALRHVTSASSEDWRRSGQSRPMWLALLALSAVTGFGVLGVAAYLLIPFGSVRADRLDRRDLLAH